MSKYVKFNEQTSKQAECICDLTVNKVYKVIAGTEVIIDDAGDEIEIMTPNWNKSCEHLVGAHWLWCDKNGVIL